MNANRPHRGATEEEANRITPYVIGAVVYTAVLNGVMYDLIDTLKDERTYNDRAKKVLRMLPSVVPISLGLQLVEYYARNWEKFND